VKNILVAIDSFETTTVASPLIEKTIEMAKAFSSRVWVLHVAPPSRQHPFNVDRQILRREVSHELHDEHEFVQQFSQCLRDRDVDAKSLLIEGTTVNTILHESERLEIDLIIMGCRRHGELFGALVNETDEGMLAKCSHPIMFVPVSE
jgi:nucleotide-binding universal stress UspA family protein